jgi:transposase
MLPRIPENHLVHFIIEAVEKLDMSGFKVNETGSGSKQFPPRMMVALLLYCYATGRMSSRVIDRASAFTFP